MNPRAGAFALLALANLFWAGNWVLGRALRDAFDPVSLNFWRWLLATAVLAPFALPGLRGKWLHSELDAIERVQVLRELREGAFDVLVGVNLLR